MLIKIPIIIATNGHNGWLTPKWIFPFFLMAVEVAMIMQLFIFRWFHYWLIIIPILMTCLTLQSLPSNWRLCKYIHKCLLRNRPLIGQAKKIISWSTKWWYRRLNFPLREAGQFPAFFNHFISSEYSSKQQVVNECSMHLWCNLRSCRMIVKHFHIYQIFAEPSLPTLIFYIAHSRTPNQPLVVQLQWKTDLRTWVLLWTVSLLYRYIYIYIY